MKCNLIIIMLILMICLGGCKSENHVNNSDEGTATVEVEEQQKQDFVAEKEDIKDSEETLERTLEEGQNVLLEHISQYEGKIWLITTSPIPDTILALIKDDGDRWFLVNSDGNILHQYDREGNRLYEPVKGQPYTCNNDSIKLRAMGYLILDDGENIKLVDRSGETILTFEDDTVRSDFALAGNTLFQFFHNAQKIITYDIQ